MQYEWVLGAVSFVIAAILAWPLARGYRFGRSLRRLPTQVGRTLALTFDDGPNEPYTSELLSVLREYNIRATFFLVGVSVMRFPETVRRIAAEGHEIGNHSWDHAFAGLFSPTAFRDGVVRTQGVIEELTGNKPALFRFPWFYEAPWLLRALAEGNMRAVGGAFASWSEVFQPSPKRLARQALRNARPGTILIFHDGYNGKSAYRGATVKAVKLLLPLLAAKGYHFMTVSEALAGSKKENAPRSLS